LAQSAVNVLHQRRITRGETGVALPKVSSAMDLAGLVYLITAFLRTGTYL